MKTHWIFIATAISALLLQTLAKPLHLAERLVYDRAAVLDGELWRIVTSQVMHGSWTHCLLDVGGLLFAGFLLSGSSARIGGAAMFGGTAGVGAGLMLLSPEVSWYMGLSGVVHGCLAVAGVLLLATDRAAGSLVIIVILTKVAAEQLGWWPTTSVGGLPILHDAHLYGVVGSFIGLMIAHRSMHTAPTRFSTAGTCTRKAGNTGRA